MYLIDRLLGWLAGWWLGPGTERHIVWADYSARLLYGNNKTMTVAGQLV